MFLEQWYQIMVSWEAGTTGKFMLTIEPKMSLKSGYLRPIHLILIRLFAIISLGLPIMGSANFDMVRMPLDLNMEKDSKKRVF